MKKFLAVLLAVLMAFSMLSVVAFAEDTYGDGNLEGDEQYEGYYTVLNFFTDLINRLNILIEYIMTVFFPNAANG